MALDELTPYEKNARQHSESQINKIIASIREFGFTMPLLESRGIIVAGHGRYEAAKRLYASGETLKLTDGHTLPLNKVPVIDCSKWSETQCRAYTLADNRLSELSSWDHDLLESELAELDNLDFDYSFFEFDDINIDTPDFQPASIDEQGKLDEIRPRIVACPNCGELLDARKL